MEIVDFHFLPTFVPHYFTESLNISGNKRKKKKSTQQQHHKARQHTQLPDMLLHN